MKKVAVEFEQKLSLVRTVVVELEDEETPDFSDYVKSGGDELDDIADRIEADGFKIIEISDITNDFENSSQDDIDYRDDSLLDKSHEEC